MLHFLKKDPIQRLERKYQATLQEATCYQGAEHLETFGRLMWEANRLYMQIEEMKAQQQEEPPQQGTDRRDSSPGYPYLQRV